MYVFKAKHRLSSKPDGAHGIFLFGWRNVTLSDRFPWPIWKLKQGVLAFCEYTSHLFEIFSFWSHSRSYILALEYSRETSNDGDTKFVKTRV